MLTFRFYGFPVPEFGTYLFEVHHGDERLAQVPFWVVPVDVETTEGPLMEGPAPGAPEGPAPGAPEGPQPELG